MEAAAALYDDSPLPQKRTSSTPSPNGKGVVYKSVIPTLVAGQKCQEEWWLGAWNDHAHRLIVRRVEPTAWCSSQEQAWVRAQEIAQSVIDEKNAALIEKDRASLDQLEAKAESVNFPREVVAKEIRRLLRLVSADLPDSDLVVGTEAAPVQPGFKLFAIRTQISTRELHRIMRERQRLTVTVSAVDRICVEFDLILNDFVMSSLDWAEKRGAWKDRPGTRDPWPYGRVYRVAPVS